MANKLKPRDRWIALAFPPAGLILLWRDSGIRLLRKFLNSVFLLIYLVVYATALIGLMLWAGILQLEWRGGFPPVLTFSKTVPDYDALDSHRAGQTTGIPQGTRDGGNYWTGYRGADRTGHYNEQPILTEWPESGLALQWRQPVGGGYASMTVVKGMLFTIEQRRDQEVVVAYDAATGKEIWTHGWPERFDDEYKLGGEGPRSTPTWHADRLYAIGARGQFLCLDAASGDVEWQHDLLEEEKARVLEFGFSASPLIVDDTVVVVGGKGTKNCLLAYDLETGKSVWKGVDKKPSYTSPMLVTLAETRQILLVGGREIMGVNPTNGVVLWEHPWEVQYGNAISQPVLFGDNRVFLSAGYGKGCTGLEISRTESGFSVKELWRNRFMKNKFNSSVLHEGHIYGLDEGILTCMDPNTGKRVWKDGRYGYGQILLADGHLVILAGMGDLVLVKAGTEGLNEVARFPALEGKTWNYPSMADGRLFARNAVEMACFQIGR